MKNRGPIYLVMLAVLLMEACASPATIIEDAMTELARSPNVDVSVKATPCGFSGVAISSAGTRGGGLKAKVTLILEVAQECKEVAAKQPTDKQLEPNEVE